MSEIVKSRIQKSYGRSRDEYSLWRFRDGMCFKVKGYWNQLQKENCPQNLRKSIQLLC